MWEINILWFIGLILVDGYITYRLVMNAKQKRNWQDQLEINGVAATLRSDTEEFESLYGGNENGQAGNRTESCFPGVSKLPTGEEGENN